MLNKKEKAIQTNETNQAEELITNNDVINETESTNINLITPVKEAVGKPKLTVEQCRIMSHQAIQAYYNS